jgi:hypothetical protein
MCFLRGVKCVGLAAAVVAGAGAGVMYLWNGLMPDLFGWHAVTYWQALGLLVLGRILFGGFGGRGCHGGGWRRQMAERWETMSPEERERFRQGLRGGCC